MKKIRIVLLLTLMITLMFGCSDPLQTVIEDESPQVTLNRSSTSFSPRVSPYTTVTSSKKYLSSGTYEVSINTMNPSPNATVRILNNSGSSVATYYIRSNTNKYKLNNLASGNYSIQITNNANDDLFIGVSVTQESQTPNNPGNSQVSFSPRVSPYATAISSILGINKGTYDVSINTMNPSPNATVQILKSSGASIATYYVTKSSNFYKLNIYTTGDYKIKITNNKNDDLFIGVSLK